MAILEFLEKKFTKKVNNFILVITQGGLRGVIAYWLKKFEIFFFKFFKKKIPTAKKINKFKRLFSNSNVGFKKQSFIFKTFLDVKPRRIFLNSVSHSEVKYIKK